MDGIKKQAIGSFTLALIGTAALLTLTRVIGQQQQNNIWLYGVYQAITLAVAFVVIILMRVLKGGQLNYLQQGDLKASTQPIPLLAVKKTDNWRNTGITFALITAVATGAYLFFAYRAQLAGVELSGWLLALVVGIPLALTNSFTEGIVTRWTIAEGFTGSLSPYAPWVSALIFGIVHYFGIPGGWAGSLMAGFLAWLLVRSIQDTRGIAWSWFIHFCLDVLIFTVTIALFI